MIKKTILTFFAFTFLFVSFDYAQAEEQKIMILDRNKLMKESTALLAVTKEISKKTDVLREEFLKTEEKLKKKSEKLREQQEKITNNEGGLSKEVWKKAYEKYRRELTAFQNTRREKDQYYTNAYQNGLKQVLLEAEIIIQDVMKEKKVDLVLWKSQVVSASNKLDITEDVIKQLNERLPKVKKPIFEN